MDDEMEMNEKSKSGDVIMKMVLLIKSVSRSAM